MKFSRILKKKTLEINQFTIFEILYDIKGNQSLFCCAASRF